MDSTTIEEKVNGFGKGMARLPCPIGTDGGFVPPRPRDAIARGQTIDRETIVQTLAAMMEPGQVTEIRALDATTYSNERPTTYSGYFNDAEKAASEVKRLITATGVYFVPNVVNPDLLGRALNKIRSVGKQPTTSDQNILRRRWILIDCDSATKPAGTSSSDNECRAAHDRATEIDHYLMEQGWPPGITADSGNGAHLLYRIDLPAADGRLVERCLKALQAKFGDSDVKVDETVFNPARIWKLYGTRACKGDCEAAEIGRPWRMSGLINMPESFGIVSAAKLEALAALAPAAEQPKAKATTGSESGSTGTGPESVEELLARCGVAHSAGEAYEGGTKYVLSECAFDASHQGKDAAVFVRADGTRCYKCFHNSCNGLGWKDFRKKVDPTYVDPADLPPVDHSGITGQAAGPRTAPAGEEDDSVGLTLEEMIAQHPRLNDPVIHGLLRRGETMNMIAAPKRGKSWGSYELAVRMTVGGKLWDTFTTVPGKVLIIDNELHPSVSAERIPKVAAVLGIPLEDCQKRITVKSIRGKGWDINRIAHWLRRNVKPGEFSLIIIDAFYRVIPSGTSENDNAGVMALYNTVDGFAGYLNAGVVLIHHTSKGNQAGKSVTDTGAGAGSQSRAADTHLIMRQHECPEKVVVDAAVRSFPPLESAIVLRWEYPVWRLDSEADPEALKTEGPKKQPIEPLAGQVFVWLENHGACTCNELHKELGGGVPRIRAAIKFLLGEQVIEQVDVQRRNGLAVAYQVKNSTTSTTSEVVT